MEGRGRGNYPLSFLYILPCIFRVLKKKLVHGLKLVIEGLGFRGMVET
jgi:hypothetical protein